MVADCLFCSIVAGAIPADEVLRTDEVVAFRDIAPKAPTHVLVIPTRHVPDIGGLGAFPDTAAALVAGVGAVASALGLDSYRTVLNTGAESGQTVFHVHAHVLAGRSMAWPPG